MKKIVVFAALVLAALPARAQDRLADQLRKGVVEEETGKNLDKAIQAYQSVVAQYDAERKTAGTALFRLAECYRKAGKRDQAVAAYQRVVREFPDQGSVAEPSRKQLASFGVAVPAEERIVRATTAGARLADQRARERAAARDRAIATTRERETAGAGEWSQFVSRERQNSLDLTRLQLEALQKRLAEAKGMVERGTLSPADVEKLEMELVALQKVYQQQMAEQQAERVNAERLRTLNEQMIKSVQAEIVLVEERITALQKRVEIGTLAREDPELLQLRRDLLGLQRKLDELKLNLVR